MGKERGDKERGGKGGGNREGGRVTERVTYGRRPMQFKTNEW